ncbi:MAG TPA: DUF1439 domain-containing protein [Ramlibacter sp.]|nr:DUF1439 domain-containing protein [Ramlibacter sp.]
MNCFNVPESNATMHRRSVLAFLSTAPWAALAQDAGQPRHKLSAATLHQGLSARFPLRLDVGGLLQLQVSAPQLLLQPRSNKLGATLVVEGLGASLQQVPAGEADVVFALRYAPADRSLRGHELDLLALRWPALRPEATQVLQRVLPGVAREAVGEIVLHRFTERDLALADTMGLQPERFTVVDDGLVVGFGPKPKP